MNEVYEKPVVSLDLSSFPLLRIDQLHLHDTHVLLQSQEDLSIMVMKKQSPDESNDFWKYACKLIDLISKEIAKRKVQKLLSDPKGKQIDTAVCVKPKADDSNQQAFTDLPPLRRHNSVSNHSSPKLNRKRGKKPLRAKSCINTSPKPKAFVVSSSSQGGFRSRAKARSTIIKRKTLERTEEYTKQLLEEKKRIRRQQAKKRIDARRTRRAAIEAKLENRRRRKAEKEQIQKGLREKVQEEMKRVAHAVEDMVREKDLEEEQVRVIAATAAAKVMNAAELDILESDSGSSLASDVGTTLEFTIESEVSIDDGLETNTKDGVDSSSSLASEHGATDLESDTDDNGADDDSKIGNKIVANSNLNHEISAETNYTAVKAGIATNENNDELSFVEENTAMKKNHMKPDILTPSIPPMVQIIESGCKEDLSGVFQDVGDTGSRNEEAHDQNTASVHNERPIQTDSVDRQPWSPTINVPKEQSNDEVTQVSPRKVSFDWQPWSPTTSKIPKTDCCNVEETQNQFLFTDIFPTFGSIFTAFAGTNANLELSDVNMNIERECLEYQVKLHSSLSQLREDEEGNFNDTLLFSTKSIRPEVSAIISDVLVFQGEGEWEDVSSEPCLGNCWNLLWTWKKPKLNPEHLLVFQRISRFQNTTCFRKDYLKKHLERYRSSLTRSQQNTWNVMPLTFILPGEYTLFLSAFSSIQKSCQSKNKNRNLWIMKPVGMSRGRGISLINDVGKVTYSSPTVIQQYLPNPLLLQGYKFDLRLYILVTSFSPLEAFIYNEGFGRFGSRKFSSQEDTLNDLQIHLTNSSIQKDYDCDISSTHPAKFAGKDGGGNKVKMTWLWEQLNRQGLDSDNIWKNIKELCLKTLISVGDEIPYQPNAFEIFGFDVILDENTKPFLIEVNSCPALARETDLDVIVKESLIEDTIKLVSPADYNRDALAEICNRRLYQKKRGSMKNASNRKVLEHDLRRIFNNVLPRKYGEEPTSLTRYERLAPGKLFDLLKKQKKTASKVSSPNYRRSPHR